MAFRLRGCPLLWLVLSLSQISIATCLTFHRLREPHDPWPPAVTARAVFRNESQIEKRGAINTELSTCGYLNGDPNRIRTANDGFDCRVDTRNGLWGFCPTTVIAATDCGLAGSCVDRHACSKGCGLTQSTQLTTFTCESQDFCSFALLTFGVDQTYSYLACGGVATTDHYLISPTAPASTPKMTSATTSSSAQSTSSSQQETSSSAPAPSPSASTPSRATATASSPTGAVSGGSAGHDDGSGGGKNHSETGAIIGGIIGGLALVCGSAVAIIYLLRRNRSAPPAYDGPNLDSPSKHSLQPGRAGAGDGGTHVQMVYELPSMQTHGMRYAELPT